MVAPIDARATVTVDGESFALVMNYRTIALAEDAKPDVVTTFGSGRPTLTGMATLVWAFAQPAHPELSQDEALALVLRGSKDIGDALGQCFRLATKGADAPDDDAADPPRAKRAKASA